MVIKENVDIGNHVHLMKIRAKQRYRSIALNFPHFLVNHTNKIMVLF